MKHLLLLAEVDLTKQQVLWIVGAVGLVVFLIFMLIFFSFLKLWIQSLLAGAKIGFLDMIRMKLLNIDYSVVVRQKVVTAVIAAHKAGLDLPWRVAAAIDLAGRNVLDAVMVSVYPKVIDCPDPSKGRPTLDGVCKNGIQLRARARVT